jgi:peptidyl-prolyl cis-trans isomerase D
MLSLMRKHAGSWLIKVILGVIVVVFIFWGVGSYRAQRGNQVAVVNGATISLEAYRSAYNQLMEQYRKQFGNALDEKLLKTLDLKRQALDQLINRELVLQQANRIDLRVTKEELGRAIQKIAAFQLNGQFDPRRYQRTLALNRMTPEMFEESMQEELLAEKMQGLIVGGIKVSDAEAMETFNWREEQVSLEYVAFTPSSYKGVKVAPQELETYFADHQKDYEIPPKVKVRYLRFGFKDFESQVKVSEEEVSQYFELNKEQYGSPKKVRARHILLKLEPEATQEQIDAVRDKALKVLEETRAETDFAKLAETYSDDPGSKNKGGDLGFFTEDRMVKPFSDAAFAMKPGEISEPVKTRFGWHLIKVEEVQEAKEPVLAEVEEQIRSKLVKEGARSLAYDRAEETADAFYGGGHMEDVAKARGLKTLETDFFALRDRVEGITEANKFTKAAFDLSDDEVSESFELADGHYILEVIGRRPAEIPDLDVVEARVKKDLTSVRQDELARNDAETFLNALTGGIAFQEEAKNRKLDPKETGFFKRFGSIPGIGPEKEVMDIAFSLSPSDPLPGAVIKGRQGYYVIRLKDRQEADPKEFEAKKSDTKSSMIFQKRQELMDEWLAQLRQEGEITIEEGFLD